MSVHPNKKNLLRRGSTVATLAVLLLHVAPTWAQSSAVDDTTTPTLQDLDQKIRILQRQLEVADETAATKAPAPIIGADGDGFVIKSADGNFVLKSKALLQVDYRNFLGDTNYNDVRKPADAAYTDGDYLRQFPKLTNSFLLRKVRPIWDVTLYKFYNFRLTPDFGGGTTVVQDAYGEVNYWPELKLRVGKFTPPLSIERIQASSDNNFVEYNLPSALAPSRDIGVQLYGDLLGESVNYTAGIFNGAPDGANQDVENTNSKDLIGRVFVQPFKNLGLDFLSGLGVGIGGSWGAQWGDSVTSNLPSYKSSGQNTFFSYFQNKSKGTIGAAGTIPIAAGTVLDSNSVRAAGTHYRINPQGYWYVGPFSLLGEYISSTQQVSRSKPLHDSSTGTKTFIPRNVAELTNQAWGISATWVVTGEPTSFKSVKPRHGLGPGSGIGAIELVARAGQLILDKNTFPLYADSTASARKATSFGGGVNWYFNRAIRWTTDYEYTVFEQGAKDAAGKTKDRDPEQALTSRLQVNF